MAQNDQLLVHVRPHLTPVKGTLGLVFSFLSVFCILVIFFQKITTGSAEVRGVSVNVKLPKSSGELAYAAKDMIVTVNEDKEKINIYFADSIISGSKNGEEKNSGNIREVLKQRITGLSAGFQAKRLIVRADAGVSLSTIVMIMTVAKELDMDVFLMTENEAPKDRVEMREKENK